MSQTSLPLTSHHFWLKRPCDLSSSVHSMTLLSSLTFSGPFNISYIFLTWQTMISDPQLTGGSVLPALLWNRACCSIQPVPAQCFLTAYFKVLHFRQVLSMRRSWQNLFVNLKRKLSKLFIPSFLLLMYIQSWNLLLLLGTEEFSLQWHQHTLEADRSLTLLRLFALKGDCCFLGKAHYNIETHRKHGTCC